ALIGHHRFGKLGGESLVSAITETPASGPAGPVTTPPRSLSPMSIAMPASSAREDTTAVATSAAVAIAAAHKSKACMGRFVINDDLLLGPGAQVDVCWINICTRRSIDCLQVGSSRSLVPQIRAIL